MYNALHLATLAAVDPSAMNVPIDLGRTFGALLIGLSFALILWGMQTLQSVWYYLNYPKDPLILKIWVAVISVLSTLDVGFSFAGVWEGAIRNSGTPPDAFSTKPIFWRIIAYGFVGFLCQLFFLYRIVKFAEARIIKYGIPILLMPLMIYQMIANFVYAALWLKSDPGTDIAAATIKTVNATSVWVVSSYAVTCATDVIIALVMSGLLLQKRSGIAQTDKLLVKIAVTSINTGTWTAIDALLTVIFSLVTPNSDFIFAIPSWFASVLYVNTVLCNLNVRQFFRAKDTERNSKGLGSIRMLNPGSWGSGGSSGRVHTEQHREDPVELIRVERRTERHSDEFYNSRSKIGGESTLSFKN